MLVSQKWLAELVDLHTLAQPATSAVIAERLTAAGLEVEAITDLSRGLAGVVVGKVVSCVPHPQADKLKLCTVDAGPATPDGPVDVVCGASNVATDAWVCFATPGTVLPGGKAIAVAAVRGITSNGMLCSAAELGLEASSDGLLLLADGDPGVVPGAPIDVVLWRDDTVFSLGVTPNRPDALCHLGVARELSAAFRTRLKAQTPACPERGGPIDALGTVTIEDQEGCTRYSCRVIEDVVIGPSPRWLQSRLAAIGIRSINNVVDVTNLVMMERGLPLHAFDLDKIGKNGSRASIIVRSARAGEAIVTLDGKERALVEGDVVIADPVRAIAIAGVMGGKDTEVTTMTTRVLLEAAHFNPSRVRKTARRLDLHSEASHRFERGADPNATLSSLDRAAALIADLSGKEPTREGKGRVSRGVVDSYPKKVAPLVVMLRPKRAAQLLGVSQKVVDEASASKMLLQLGLEVEGREAEAIRFRVPTFRPDLTREVDLIEELMRLIGTEQIPLTLPSRAGETENALFDQRRHRTMTVARRALAAAGYDEAVNLAFSSAADVKRFAVQGAEAAIALKNPLGEERSLMRQSLLPALVGNVALNQRRGVVDVKLYETGVVFLGRNPQGLSPKLDNKQATAGADAYAIERPRLAGIAVGAVTPSSFDKPAVSLDFFDVKGHLEELAEQIGVPQARFTALADDERAPFLHPRARAVLTLPTARGPVDAGIIGELHPDVVAAFDLRGKVVAFELDCNVLAEAAVFVSTSRPLPRFPAVRRDFAVVVDESLPAMALKEKVEGNAVAGPLLEGVDIFDVYQGKGVAPGKKSIALSVRLRADDKTLTDEDIQRVSAALIDDVKALGADIR